MVSVFSVDTAVMPELSMDFGLGETADAIRESTARFAAANIAPRAAEIDAR